MTDTATKAKEVPADLRDAIFRAATNLDKRSGDAIRAMDLVIAEFDERGLPTAAKQWQKVLDEFRKASGDLRHAFAAANEAIQ